MIELTIGIICITWRSVQCTIHTFAPSRIFKHSSLNDTGVDMAELEYCDKEYLLLHLGTYLY